MLIIATLIEQFDSAKGSVATVWFISLFPNMYHIIKAHFIF